MSLRRDLREAWRQWRRTPVITVAALLSLVVGIGASSAIFSLLNGLLLKQLPIRDPQQVVTFRQAQPPTPLNLRVSYPMFTALARDGAGMAGIAAYAYTPFNLSPPGEPVRNGRGLFVSGSYFDLLGVMPIRGRLLTPADDDVRAPSRNVVVSEAFWRGALAGDEKVLGRELTIRHQRFTIVGVIDGRYLGLEVGQAFDIAIPVAASAVVNDRSRLTAANLPWLTVIGRLRAEDSIAGAEARLPAVQARAIAETPLPDSMAAALKKSTWQLLPTVSAVTTTRANYQRPLWILLAITMIVLLVACVNIANLLITRLASRRGELAVRLSLGATRTRIIRQLALEAVVLAIAGTIAGVAFGVVGSRALIWLLSTSRNPVQLDLSIDWRVAMFAAAAGVLTAVAAGVLPAWRTLALDPIDAIKSRAVTVIGGSRRGIATQVLIAAQVAMTFVLVIGGLVFSSSFARLVSEERGFDRGRVLIVDVMAPAGASGLLTPIGPMLQERLRSVPGVADVALSRAAPFGTVRFISYASVTGPQADRKSWPQSTHVVENPVGANYFDVMGIRVIAGRGFSGTADRTDIVIVNDAFTKRFFNGESALGRTIWLGLEQRAYEVAGVVVDTKAQSLRDEPPAIVYTPWNSESVRANYVSLSVRTATTSLSPAAIAKEVEPAAPGTSVDVRSLDVEIADTIAVERATATLAFVFGIAGLLLAAIGLYGVLSRDVHVRMPEIAVRMALGAAPARVRRLVVAQIIATAAVGVVAGILLTLSAARFVRSFLYEVQPSDPSQLITCVAIMLLVTIVSIAAPIRRATRVDPMTVLRSE
jgi:putative ABC transport system permease protein